MRVRVIEDSATHTPWINGRQGRRRGVASVAMETVGQWCWILLLGRRGSLPLNEMRRRAVVSPEQGKQRQGCSGSDQKGCHGCGCSVDCFLSWGGATESPFRQDIGKKWICNQGKFYLVHEQLNQTYMRGQDESFVFITNRYYSVLSCTMVEHSLVVIALKCNRAVDWKGPWFLEIKCRLSFFFSQAALCLL